VDIDRKLRETNEQVGRLFSEFRLLDVHCKEKLEQSAQLMTQTRQNTYADRVAEFSVFLADALPRYGMDAEKRAKEIVTQQINQHLENVEIMENMYKSTNVAKTDLLDFVSKTERELILVRARMQDLVSKSEFERVQARINEAIESHTHHINFSPTIQDAPQQLRLGGDPIDAITRGPAGGHVST
jgi:hypothetical protein